MCNVASRQLLNRVLKYRRACAAELLGTIRSVKTVEINNKNDFGDTRHTVSTEPYFYDLAYQLVKRQPVDKQGKCVVAEITIVQKNKNKENKKASTAEGKPATSNNSNASNKKSKDKKNTMEIWPCTSAVTP